MVTFVVLLRAIGPVTHRIMSMAQWREAVAAAGFINPQTYVATGNMIVEGSGTPGQVTEQMDAVVRGLGLGEGNKAVVRTSRQLQMLVKSAPFPDAIAQRAGTVGVHFFAKARPSFDWVAHYQGPERIHIAGQHLIVDYDDRSTSSRLPAIIERESGTATARNWNTVKALAERAAARG
ncbi:MAG TPA: DUF1697 domain-containing protein [Devosia sp.]|jgi:uncharacterized protein (DUF1697 family)|nr:DUF1697 domain-containing protein [Devosia sp.]